MAQSNMIKNRKKPDHSFSSGFSLVELLVAIAIFSIVITAILGVFITIIKEQKIILGRQEIADNARYAMEFMSKELRMANSITNNGGNFPSLTFTNSNCDSNAVCHEIIYSLDNGKIMRKDTYLGVTKGNQAISSDKITISKLSFLVNGWSLTEAPRVTIVIKGEKTVYSAQKVFLDLQSTISPRLY